MSTKNDIFIKKLREMVREELKSFDEKSPSGWEGTVKALKKHGDEVDNPWALAHWMKEKGYKSHKESVTDIKTILNENPAAAAAAAMAAIQIQNAQGKKIKGTSALQSSDPSVQKKAKGIFQRLKDKFAKSKGKKDFEKQKKAVSKGAADYIRKLDKESVNEDDLGLTYKKGKTVKVTHKKSGKELVVVDTPPVRKKYKRMGFEVEESVNESAVSFWQDMFRPGPIPKGYITQLIKKKGELPSKSHIKKIYKDNGNPSSSELAKSWKDLTKEKYVRAASGMWRWNKDFTGWESVNEMPNFDRGTSGLPRGWIEDYNKIIKKLSKGKGWGALSRSDKQKVWAALGKKYVESVNEAKTVSIDGEELMNFLMKRFKYSKKKAIDVMKKHKMDTSFLKKESVNESSYTQRSILDFIKANKAAVESDPANIPRIKLFGPKQDSKYLNISLAGLAKIAKIVKNESVNEAKKMRFTKDGKRIISKSVWLRMPDYAKLRKNGVEHVLSSDPKKKGRSKYIPVQIESVNEAAKAKAGDYVKTIAGIAQIEKVRGSIAYMKLPGKKTKGYWMNDLKFLKSTGKMEKGKPLWTEGFGGELKGKDREKFEKARKENAEQLGYKLTGKGDIREAIKFSKEEMAQLHQNGKLEKDGYTYVYKEK